MKSKYYSLSVIAIAGFMLLLTACRKDGHEDNRAFVGTYNGTDALDAGGGGPVYYGSIRILASGVNAQQITIVDSVYEASFSGVVSGNSITSISGSTYALGNYCSTETFTGSGNLSNNQLIYTLYGTYFCNGYNNYDTLRFSGTKQ